MTVTARGIGLAGAGVVLLVAGFALGYAELALLGTAALLAVGCAIGYAAWRPRLGVRRSAEPDRVTRGGASTVTLTVHNSSRLRSATLIAEDQCGVQRIPVPLLRLRPGRDTVVNYPVPTQRRGVVPIGPLRVSRGDPLGLVSMARTHGETIQVWVHPRSYPLAAVPAGVSRSLDGRIDRVPHGSITFAMLREYVVGDELRNVHWRTSARVGELMVRERLDTSLPRIAILLDDRLGSWPGAADGSADGFEAACEAAASVISAAIREDLAVSLHLVAGSDPPGGADRVGANVRDAARARPLLDRLAEATLLSTPDGTQSADGRLEQATARLRQHRVGDTLVYLTGAGGTADLGLVAALRGPYPAVLVGVLGADQRSRRSGELGGHQFSATAGDEVDRAPSTVQGVLVLQAADGAEFASAWDGVRSW